MEEFENKPTENGEKEENNGFAQSEQSGYYTRSGSDIIQDDISRPKEDYRPTGSYGNGNPNFSHGAYNTQNYNTMPTKPVKVKRDKSRYGAGVIIAASVLAAIIGAVSSVAVLNLKDNKGVVADIGNGQTSNVNINIDETVESVVEAVAQKAMPSVVGIRTTTSVLNFFGGNQESKGEGSGVVYTADGYIITNYHVIESAVQSSTKSKIEVFVGSQKSDSYEASVIGYNISSDLAVIKINANGLTPVAIGDSSKLKAGQYAIIIGCPGGLEFMGSVTYGVISGLDRVVSSSSNVALIQTDAAINPGNSGGALLNTKGELIGINSSKIVSEEIEAMGFAIPVNTVKEKCDGIIAKQNSPEPYVGITISEKYTPEVLEYYGYPSGAVVLSVDDDSPAYKAGIRRGDIITEFDGNVIVEYKILTDLLSDCKPNKTVSVKLYRSGKYYTTDIKVGSNNAQ